MPDPNKFETIKITLDDLAEVNLPESSVPMQPPSNSGAKTYGTVSEAAEQMAPVPADERGSILLQGWFYLGLAGLIGSVLGWGLAEPFFIDGGRERWGNLWLLPLVLTFMSLGFGIAESTVERSTRKALLRGALSLPLGVVLGFFFFVMANLIFTVTVRVCFELGAQTNRNPAFWIARGIAWMVFGAAGGFVYGIVGQSSKKGTYGVLGGMIGAGLGGVLFDPISLLTHGGAASRGVGFGLVGLATGVAMGLVESALKDRWLYVTAGPLAGKQFILYKSRTIMGSEQRCDIYLFKDPSILPQHARIEIAGARVQVCPTGNVLLAGRPIQTRVLRDGDLLQIGRYTFRYKEKQRS